MVNFTGHERENNVGEKKDRKYSSSSSSSEEDDKDGKNETAINVGNKIHRKRESQYKEERHIEQSPMVFLF